MPVSLLVKLALFVSVLAASLVVTSYRGVHKATQFQTIDARGGLGEIPPANNNARWTLMDEKTEIEMEEVAEEIEEERGPMNILLFYADDWGHDTLGAAGNPVIKMPVLDALAAEGVRFSKNCVTTSIWVSRTTLYSGQYLARHHFEMLGSGRTLTIEGAEVNMGFEVPQNETIYSLLKQEAGYTTAHVGKIGLWVDMDNELNWDLHTDDDGWHWRMIGDRMWHITEKNTADALCFLVGRDKKKPFFMNVAYFTTHAVDNDKRQYMPQNSSMLMYEEDIIPIPATAMDEAWKKMPPFFSEYNEGCERWKKQFDMHKKHQWMMKNYYRMASEVDTSAGTIINDLAEKGRLDNTLINITTDNGNFHAEHGKKRLFCVGCLVTYHCYSET
jgi:arylsulfatase